MDTGGAYLKTFAARVHTQSGSLKDRDPLVGMELSDSIKTWTI